MQPNVWPVFGMMCSRFSADAAQATGVTVGEFTSAPIYPTEAARAGLELAVEVEHKPAADAIESFRRAFDASLKRQNVDYTTKRTDDLGMAPPTITPLPIGALHDWMRSKDKLGGQHKAPRCANHRDIIDGVRAIAGVADPALRRRTATATFSAGETR